MQTEQEYVLLRYPGDRVVILGFITQGRGNILPFGAYWLNEKAGWWYRSPTPQNIAEEMVRVNETLRLSHNLGAPLSVALTDKAVLPEFVPGQHRYRAAWRTDGQTISVDMEHAKELHRERLRSQRQPLLDNLDREYTRATALRLGDEELAKIEAERQVLRDVTADPRIEAATTLADLRTITISSTSR